jgi:HPt (histidine-containing phosphotransfer) domain-containing protein
MAEASVFQGQVLEALRDQLGDEGGELVREILQRYLKQAQDLVAQIEIAGTSLEVDRLRALAHKLKGSTATLGGARLAAVCQRIELAQDADFDFPGAAQDVRREFELLAGELTLTLASLSRLKDRRT